MTKSLISVILKSIDTEKVDVDVYDYKYTLIKDIRVELSSFSSSNTRASTVTPDIKYSKKYNFVMRNDDTNRVYRICYILDHGHIYDVGTIDYYPPRVVLTLGNYASGVTLESLGIKE